MKRFSLLMLCAALFFLAGCGDGGSDYDKYGDTGDSAPDKDSADTVPDKDSADSSEEPADSDTDEPDGDTETQDENENGDSDTAPVPEDFWATCEGIIACSRGCTEGDSECVGECYGNGDADGQLNYRRWRECFDSECAEDNTPECSAEKCHNGLKISAKDALPVGYDTGLNRLEALVESDKATTPCAVI